MLLSLDNLPVSADLSVCLYFGFLAFRVNFYRTRRQIVIKIKLLRDMSSLSSRNEIESALFFPVAVMISPLNFGWSSSNTVLYEKDF